MYRCIYRDLCKDNGWGTIIRIKLIAAVKSTAGSAASKGPTQIVFLGDEEKEILDKLYKKAEGISSDMNALQKAINGMFLYTCLNISSYASCVQMII